MLDITPVHVLALAAGALLIAIGFFVLLARPHAALHRMFFVFALVDGMSTILFELRNMAPPGPLREYLMATYWYFFIAFNALLTCFALAFPTPTGRARDMSRTLVVAGSAWTLVLIAYAARHDWFWTRAVSGAGYTFSPLGHAVIGAFVLATSFAIVRLARAVLNGPMESHSRQAVFVFGGMMLGYAPFATTSFASRLMTDPAYHLFGARIDLVLLNWTYALACVVFAAVAVAVIRNRDETRRDLRRIAGASIGGVLALTLITLASPSLVVVDVIQIAGILAYPALLAYAIARYELFDINARVRRAAMLPMLAASMSAIFIVVESNVATVLEGRVFAGFGSDATGSAVAGLAAAAVALPFTHGIKRFLARVMPDLAGDEMRRRKLEIYAHSLAGALSDGIMDPHESRALTALRESLGITTEDHDRIAGDLKRALPSPV